MTPNEYQELALRTESHFPDETDLVIDEDELRLCQGLMGLNGEAGEAIDIFKKHLFQGHELDLEHLARELGDVAWYLAISADAIGFTLEEIFEINIKKLRARYPDGFEAERSLHRAREDD